MSHKFLTLLLSLQRVDWHRLCVTSTIIHVRVQPVLPQSIKVYTYLPFFLAAPSNHHMILVQLVSYMYFLLKGAEAPAMPTSTTPLPSGTTVRVRRVASMKNLTESQASSIGLAKYYHRYSILALYWMLLN